MSAVASDSITLSSRGLWKVFGLRPGHYFDTTGCQIDPEALVARLRQEGHIPGVADATFDVRKGEIFVIMGFPGRGNRRWCAASRGCRISDMGCWNSKDGISRASRGVN